MKIKTTVNISAMVLLVFWDSTAVSERDGMVVEAQKGIRVLGRN
jgi:hypothetical protein